MFQLFWHLLCGIGIHGKNQTILSRDRHAAELSLCRAVVYDVRADMIDICSHTVGTPKDGYGMSLGIELKSLKLASQEPKPHKRGFC